MALAAAGGAGVTLDEVNEVPVIGADDDGDGVDVDFDVS